MTQSFTRSLKAAALLALGTLLAACLAAGAVMTLAVRAHAATGGVPTGRPAAMLDLTTREGLAAVKGVWRFHETKIVEISFNSAGPDRKPSGAPNRTYDYEPHAGGREFDDSDWEVIDPGTLDERRSTGKLCFAWYRLRLTLPEVVGGTPVAGSTVVFETTVDDYAEVWIDGHLPRELGQTGKSLVAGWNAPNRLVVAENARPGQEIQIAIFGMNGPVSDTPSNYIWMRSAKLELFASGATPLAIGSSGGTITRLDPSLDLVLSTGTAVEKLADGFVFGEGPVWTNDGSLLFSDPNTNVIYRWNETGGVSVFRKASGYSGADIGQYRQPGSNGLALDQEGRLTICQHGNRRVVRIERDGTETVIADRYEGKRLNSPNDLVYRSDGALYFTDPYFGLPGFDTDPAKELPFSGIYCWKDGRLRLVDKSLEGPNGLAFSPDEKHLYVGNWDTKRKWLMRYDVTKDGTLGRGKIFFDMTNAVGDEALDGVKVDALGNVYVSGPGGVWVISPTGKHLGTLIAPELPANFAWGDADGQTLYLTARSGLYRVRTGVPGARASKDRAGVMR
jgi:gluconolactonase